MGGAAHDKSHSTARRTHCQVEPEHLCGDNASVGLGRSTPLSAAKGRRPAKGREELSTDFRNELNGLSGRGRAGRQANRWRAESAESVDRRAVNGFPVRIERIERTRARGQAAEPPAGRNPFNPFPESVDSVYRSGRRVGSAGDLARHSPGEAIGARPGDRAPARSETKRCGAGTGAWPYTYGGPTNTLMHSGTSFMPGSYAYPALVMFVKQKVYWPSSDSLTGNLTRPRLSVSPDLGWTVPPG